jgi:hypothetical protein
MTTQLAVVTVKLYSFAYLQERVSPISSNHLKPPQATSSHLNTTSSHLRLATLLLKRAEFQESNTRAYLWKFWRGEGVDEEEESDEESDEGGSLFVIVAGGEEWADCRHHRRTNNKENSKKHTNEDGEEWGEGQQKKDIMAAFLIKIPDSRTVVVNRNL